MRRSHRTLLSALDKTTERFRAGESGAVLKLVAVEAFAVMWLMPRLAAFRHARPEIVIEIETDHHEVDPARREFDVWIEGDAPQRWHAARGSLRPLPCRRPWKALLWNASDIGYAMRRIELRPGSVEQLPGIVRVVGDNGAHEYGTSQRGSPAPSARNR